jgi:glycosyltransferase involved in cell wall biosynthesis
MVLVFKSPSRILATKVGKTDIARVCGPRSPEATISYICGGAYALGNGDEKAMRIVMAASCPSDRNLGVPGVMHALADEYRKRGHEVRMCFRDEPGRLGEVLFGWRLSRSPLARWADVVDAHAVDAWPLAGKRRRPAVVARSHGLEASLHRGVLAAHRAGRLRLSPVYWLYRGSVRLASERKALGFADASLLLNASDLAFCRNDLGIDPSRLHLVDNGFPAEFLEAPIRDEDAPKLLFLGSWIARKGSDIAVASIARILDGHPEVRVLLAGTGISEEMVLADFPPELRERVEVVPRFRREELPEIVRGCRILLFPSRSEGYPLSLVEAMALGIAPVASAIPGVVDVVRSGESGCLVVPEDAGEMARAVDGLLRSPRELASLRTGARERVGESSWGKVAQRQLELYGGILDSRRARGAPCLVRDPIRHEAA